MNYKKDLLLKKQMNGGIWNKKAINQDSKKQNEHKKVEPMAVECSREKLLQLR
jgi:hypothetical protein